MLESVLHFNANDSTKYAFETLCIQFQLASLPPHLISQLTWDRFVNTRGGNGHNIPCDLHITVYFSQKASHETFRNFIFEDEACNRDCGCSIMQEIFVVPS